MSTIKVLKTDSDHAKAVGRLISLMDLDPKMGTKDADELELLALVIEKYEEKSFPIESPDPIEAIRFRMEQEGLTQKDLVPFIGSLSKVSEVLNRKRKLSLNMIKNLSTKLGISADILISSPTEDIPKDNIDWQKFPLSEMRKRGFFNTDESLSEIKEYAQERVFVFLDSIPGGINLQPILLKTAAHIRSNNKEVNPYTLWIWQARVLQLAAQESLCTSYKKGTVTELFMKNLSRLSWSDTGPVIAKEYLNKHGIHLVFEPHFKQTYLDGAVCFNANGNPVIALTLRYDRLDNFWFSLMHELAHIALHFDGNETWFLDDLDDSASDQDKKENDADKWATNSLISTSDWETDYFTSISRVLEFAKDKEIHPSIVIGRLRRKKGDYTLFAKSLKIPKVRHFFMS